MAASTRAPKQWSLTKQETITSFEAWRQNLQYVLSLDPYFADFLVEGVTWQKKTATTAFRGFTNDGADVPEENRRTAAQKATQLELMLGQIANFCPIISRNTIVRNSTSMSSIWQSIRQHFGFQSSGAHFIDFNCIKLEAGERPEDLYQRLNSFVEDNLLKADGTIKHFGAIPETDEEISPSLENFIVLTWLRLIHRDLPSLVKQRYGTDLRSQTLASLKPEISQALDSLLEEINTSIESKVLRSTFKTSVSLKPSKGMFRQNKVSKPICPLCKQAGRSSVQHFLSQCKYLPEDDRRYLSKARQTLSPDSDDECVNDTFEHISDSSDEELPMHNLRTVSSIRHVMTNQSPHFKVFYKHYPVHITLDSGAEISMIKTSVAHYIGAPIKKTKQTALQADGVTPLAIVGETHLSMTRDNINLQLEALVVNDLDVDVLAGIPFMTSNDIAIRPAKHQITISDSIVVSYGSSTNDPPRNRVRRTQAYVLKSESASTVVWPGEYVELILPSDLESDCTVAIESRPDCHKSINDWPSPNILEAVGTKIRVLNDTSEPQSLRKHEHFCQVRVTTDPSITSPIPDIPVHIRKQSSNTPTFHSDTVKVDPDKILPEHHISKIQSLLHQYDSVFEPSIPGYNNAVGHFESCINMGPVQPPQRKGRVPQYARDKLVELQQKFDDLENLGVFHKPEELGITVEYLNPSFLVKKSSGGFRLVTAFADVGRYTKPQPSLMPDVDSTLRTIAQWKYIIQSDLTSAFYQIPLSKDSMKYCGVATPFRGVRVYTRCAMGMPGSETALEELMCRVLGDYIQEGVVAKLADDLYCGGNTVEELLDNWSRVLESLQKCNLKLSPSKTIICPQSTVILGWVWSQGALSASPHRVAVLANCPPPDSVRGLRSFIGAYKVLGRVLPRCSSYISPLENAIAGCQSQEKVSWTDELLQRFHTAQESLSSHKAITLPNPNDQLWIVTDGSVTKQGIGATLYISRKGKLLLAGFFSAKLRKHQVTWLPCEVEALCIAASVKHFSPYIIQSKHTTCILTDSKPCVQAIEKLCRGEFSASPRVTSFLSIVSRYQVNVRHLSGSANIPSDFASRNAPECSEPQCQICNFIIQTEDSVVRSIQVQDVLDSTVRLPFVSRSAWLSIQNECQDLRRTRAHLKQGTRPSKKVTNAKDVKRYLSVASLAKDGMLVVRRNEPLVPSTELIIIPRSVLDGLVTALHIKLSHPSKHQLLLVLKRHFYALDLSKAVDRVYMSCHTCASLQKFPNALVKQSSEDPPEAVGISFAADVLKRYRQLILLVRETTTSYTTASIISDEKHETLRDSLVCLVMGMHPLDGPHAVIRVDAAPGFIALKDDQTLKEFRMSLEIGRIKNLNKNPVAEKAVLELEEELLKQEPGGGPVSQLGLSIAVARLNSRIRYSGLSARELWTQRSQFTNEQLPISDRKIILQQHQQRLQNHIHSEKSKQHNKIDRRPYDIYVGDLVYLYSDRDKTRARSRYLVISIEGEWCLVKKFAGNQLRTTSYKVKCNECYLVPNQVPAKSLSRFQSHVSENEQEDFVHTEELSPKPGVTAVLPPEPEKIPPTLTRPFNENTPECYIPESSEIPDNPIDLNITSQGCLQSTPLNSTDPDPCVGSSDQKAVDKGSDSNGSLGQSRPRRDIKRPKYLDDYVLS